MTSRLVAVPELLNRLRANANRPVFIACDELEQWPAEEISALELAGILVKASPVKSVVCPGCEQQCVMTVIVHPSTAGEAARGFIYCDKPQDIGRINVELRVLERWKLNSQTLAQSIARLLKLDESALQWNIDGTLCSLGTLREHVGKGEVALIIEDQVSLKFAGISVPLVHALSLGAGRLLLPVDTLLRYAGHNRKEPKSGIGSADWRSERARNAANARHSQPGGTLDKQQKIRTEWATGKFRTRDECAEIVCNQIGVSFSAARKALRNTPEPY